MFSKHTKYRLKQTAALKPCFCSVFLQLLCIMSFGLFHFGTKLLVSWKRHLRD